MGEKRVLNIATFTTEGTKSAILSACRGMGIDVDEASYLTSFIPTERGQSWSLSDCLYGNQEKEREPIKEFADKIAEYKGLTEIALKIEGLVKSRSVHASGIYIYNDDYTKFNAMMKASSGQAITQFDMGDSDYMGNLKIDGLTVKGLDVIRTCMDLLIKDGYLEWQGSLRATYNKYLHPKVLNYDNQEMWALVAKNAIPNLFQFDTPVGLQCAQKIKPTNVVELAVANSLMRLMPEGAEQPVDKYVRHKESPELWIEEMQSYGLHDNEIETLKKLLDEVYGVAECQELVMLLSMEKGIANFSVKEANKLRKGISKKNEKLVKEAKEMFFEHGLKNGTSENLLKYVWDTQITPQISYSFSRLHSAGYSLIALIELNLAYFYPQIYWNTACLTVDAGADEDNEDNKGTKYGKVASAIGTMQQRGIKIGLPDINSSSFGFKPDVNNNQIIYGLKGIVNIGDEVVQEIVANRPYDSFDHFLEKMFATGIVKQGQMIQLIKAGCFDSFGNRIEIMKQFVQLINPQKEKLTMQNFNMILEMDLLPEQFALHKRLFNFRKHISKNVHSTEGKDKRYLLDEYSTNFLNGHFDSSCIIDHHENHPIVSEKLLKKQYDKKMESVKEWLLLPETLDYVNQRLFEAAWNDSAEGTISKWEMDSLSFYYNEHELAHIDNDKLNFVDFFKLPEEPVVAEVMEYKNFTRKKYQLYAIAGTVLDKDKTKHTVSLLTPDGVVMVKYYEGAFANYNKQVSRVKEDGTKQVLEKSWFTRGNKIIIYGYRRGSQFRPQTYKDSIVTHTTILIDKIYEDGTIDVTLERIKD